ncbi:M48 family metallopeptidase [Eubacteriales bacterium OttesenSCG-928-N13]|nr:M48 family metallopeptidase [Eubacteriales bacterium OttesenSCG-928-N13]
MLRTVMTGRGKICYELVQTQRKSMEIRLLPDDEIRVFAPMRTPLRVCDAFVMERADWVFEARRQMRDYVQRHQSDHPMQDGAEILYEGRPVQLRIVQGKTANVQLDGGVITLTYAGQEMDPEQLRAQLKAWLIEQTRARVQQLIMQYVPLIGRAPRRITIRDQKTRWGSCSSQHNLNFNYKLIMAPPEAFDYVVIHELCHLHEFNHSDRFWARVKSHQSDYLTWKKWLKLNGKLLGV